MPPSKTPAAPSPSDPTITTGPIPEPVLRAVLAADEAMYPASLPWARLQAWVDACPALAVCFHYHDQHGDGDGDDDDIVVPLGASITLPLRAGPWQALLAGRLAEPAIAPDHLCGVSSSSAGEEEGGGGIPHDQGVVGLHVFHVERFDVDNDAARQAGRGLAARALRHALDVAAGRGWRVLGCSGKDPPLFLFLLLFGLPFSPFTYPP